MNSCLFSLTALKSVINRSQGFIFELNPDNVLSFKNVKIKPFLLLKILHQLNLVFGHVVQSLHEGIKKMEKCHLVIYCNLKKKCFG